MNKDNNTQKIIKMNELPELHNIYDTFTLQQNTISNLELNHIVEGCVDYLYDFLVSNPKTYCNTTYNEVLEDTIVEYLDTVLEEYDSDCDLDDVYDEITYKSLKLLYTIIPKRSKKGNPVTMLNTDTYKNVIQTKLARIEEKDKTQPEQRTPEWFQKRHNLLSASSIWKAIDKQSYKNNLIYEKCCPIDVGKYDRVNVNMPFHWGQKYEPVSQMYYEYKYDAIIREYGCIPHDVYHFLGASPDGINIKESSSRYGRMLEIKNIVNRDITGKPKKEYWIQTQLQMECCDLNECDFLETRFKEYETKEDFDNDGTFLKTKDNKYKGVMVQFYHNNKPFYEYAPFQVSEKEFNIWYDEIMEKNAEKSWVKNIYWWLEEVSCVLIERNVSWFNAVLPEIRETWEIIEKERVEGYEHRKPKKRVKKNNAIQTNENVKVIDILTKQFKKSTVEEEKDKKKTFIIKVDI